jgi:hypothetical protein
MSLYRVAQKFAIKLAAEELSAKTRIKQVYDLVMKLTQQNIIQLWLNASDLTGGYEEIITDPLYAIRKLVQNYWRDATQFGLSKETNSGYIAKLKEQINELEKVKLEKGLDPRANGLFGGFRESVYSVPEIAVPKGQETMRAPVNLPEQNIDNTEEITGMGYSDKTTPTFSGPFGLRDKDRWSAEE